MAKVKLKGLFITKHQFRELLEYNASMPSGTYEGKVWKRKVKWDNGKCGFMICTYENEPDQITYPDTVKNGYYYPLFVKTPKESNIRETRYGWYLKSYPEPNIWGKK